MEMTAAERTVKAEQAAIRSDKKKRRSVVLFWGICLMTIIAFADAVGVDFALTFLVGGIDSITDPSNPWLPAFQASLNTGKWIVYLATAGFCLFLSKQEA